MSPEPTLPVSQAEGLLRSCMETAVILAFQRHNIEIEEDTATIEEIAADAAGACFGEECCDDKPTPEVEQLIAYVAERDRELQQARGERDSLLAECQKLQDIVKAGDAESEAVQSALREAREEIARLKEAEENLADYASRFFRLFEQYRGAWLREMGGVIRPKHWEIDGFVLRTKDIYEKAQLVDRMKQCMIKKVKEECTAMDLFDAVFKMLAEDGRDKIPTN